MSKQYNTKLQERLEKFLKDENLSQAKAAPILGISQAALSQYRRSMYDKGDIEAVENKLKEFFQIQEEKTQNAQKAEPFRTKTSAGYIPTTISEEAYKLIRYCQLEKGIVVIDGDAGIGKTKAAAKFLQDNPSTTVYVKATPSTGSTRSLLKMIAKTLKLPENQRTEDLSVSIQEKLRETDKVIIIDEAQNLKFLTLEEIRGWVDEDSRVLESCSSEMWKSTIRCSESRKQFSPSSSTARSSMEGTAHRISREKTLSNSSRCWKRRECRKRLTTF